MFRICLGLCFLPLSGIFAATAQWIHDGDSDWNINGNWTAAFPNSTSDVANLNAGSGTITGPVNISLGAGSQNITVSGINIDGFGYTISPGGSATNTLNFTLSNTIDIKSTVALGTHTISCPIVCNSLSINNETTNVFTLSGKLSGNEIDLTGSGPISISGTTNNAVSIINGSSGATLLLNSPAGINAIGTELKMGGTATFSQANQLGTSSPAILDILSGGAVNMNGFPQKVSTFFFEPGAASLNQGGATLTFNAMNTSGGTFSGPMAITPGASSPFIENISATQTAFFNAPIDMGGNNLSISTSNQPGVNINIAGTISNGTVSKTGSGAILLGAQNIYNGGTTITFGTIKLGINDAIPATGFVQLTSNSAVLDLNGFSDTVGALSAIAVGAVVTNTGGGVGTITAGDATSQQFNGSITDGTGGVALVKQGSGTFILVGTNTYSHGTLVSAGTIQGNTTSVQGPIVNNSSVVFDQTATGTYTGTMSGSGSLTKQNTGKLVLSGTNTYSGGTLVSAGTVQGNTTSVQGPIVNNSSVIFDQAAIGTYTGTMSGSGSLTKQNTGTLILTGTNTYSGGTLVSLGTLQGNTGSLPGNIADNANLVFDQGTDGVYAGSLSGTGTLVKQGSGVLTLSNTNSISGTVTVSGGALSVNNTLAGGGAMIVASGAILQGTGTITKNATISGTLAPGNSIGTISLIGNQIFATGSTLDIELDPTTSDLVDITGSLVIQPGATLSVLPVMGVYPSAFSYNVVHTTGGITGMFTTITSSLPLFQFTIDQTFLDIDLLATASFMPFSSLIHSGNAGQVAKCLDKLSGKSCGSLSSVIATLRFIPSENELKDALLQLQPSAFTSLAIAQENDMMYVQNIIYNRVERPLCCPSRHFCGYKTLRVWASALGAHTNQKSTHHEPGFTANSPGVFLGVDSAIAEKSCIGGGLGYTHTHLNWRQQRGHANMQTAYASIYGQWDTPRVFVQSALIGGYNFYNVDREIAFGVVNPIKDTAKSYHQGMEGSFNFKTGYKFKLPATIVPFIGLNYIFVHENSFRERGAHSLDLKVQSKNSDVLVSEAGIDTSYSICTNNNVFTPFLQVSAIRESRFSGRKEKASFDCGCEMTVNGLNPSRTLGGVSTGLSTVFSDNNIALVYKGKFGKNYNDQSLYLQYLRRF